MPKPAQDWPSSKKTHWTLFIWQWLWVHIIKDFSSIPSVKERSGWCSKFTICIFGSRSDSHLVCEMDPWGHEWRTGVWIEIALVRQRAESEELTAKNSQGCWKVNTAGAWKGNRSHLKPFLCHLVLHTHTHTHTHTHAKSWDEMRQWKRKGEENGEGGGKQGEREVDQSWSNTADFPTKTLGRFISS
jgi:hypothetical protein